MKKTHWDRALCFEPRILSWALYDWANSAFATTVMAGFFPLFFKKFWSAGVDTSESTFYLGVANSFAATLIAVLAPFLGAVGDGSGQRKMILFVFTLVAVICTGGLFWVPMGHWQSALTLFASASLAFTGACAIYDALLPSVATEEDLDQVSSLGYGLGYLGGGVLLLVNTIMFLKPHWFGLSDPSQGILWSFITVAVWWSVFAVPVFLFVPEPPHPNQSVLHAMRSAVTGTWQTARRIMLNRTLFLFLVAYFFYIDGVGTIMKMAVDYGMSLGFEPGDLIKALLIVQFLGFPSALVFGSLAGRWGVKNCLYLCIGIYCLVTLGSAFMTESVHFYGLACGIAVAQGAIQALSRSHFATLIPPEQSGQYFGFFNLVGKFSAILGPALMGVVALWGGDPRLTILVVLVLFAVGAVLLRLSHTHPRSHGPQ